jgi:hypothetical protein
MRQTSFRPDRCPCGFPWELCPWSERLWWTSREPDGGGFGGKKPIRCGSPPSKFRCPRCGAVSYNPNDLRERYCGRCHVFVDDQASNENAALQSLSAARRLSKPL